MLEIKNTASEIKTVFDGVISRLGTAEESLSLRLSQEKPPKLESEENKDWEKKNQISKYFRITTRGKILVMEISEGEEVTEREEKKRKKYLK